MTEIGLADSSDAFTFVSGQPIKLLDSGAIVPMTRWDLLRVRAIAAWEWLTRRPRLVVSAVDTEAGRVTLTSQRWSWLRWRWIDSLSYTRRCGSVE